MTGARPWTRLRARLRRATEGRRRGERIDEALPGFVDAVAAAIRAGASAPVAIAEADADPPLDAVVAEVASRLRVGASLEEALAVFAERAATPQARMVATAIGIGHRSGGGLPRMLETLAEIARDRLRLAREMRASTAQARMSAWVVGSLPAGFLLMTGAGSREQMRLLFGTPIGWALLGAGGALEALGIAWMRRLAAR